MLENPFDIISCSWPRAVKVSERQWASVIIYGEHQWPEQSRRLFEALLPFAEIVPTALLLERIEELGGPKLTKMSRHWFVMKACVCLFFEPEEFCFMDDDVFILAPIREALRMFEHHDLVYVPDADHTADYLKLWGWLYKGPVRKPLPTRLAHMPTA
jgi:hypothetical protein